MAQIIQITQIVQIIRIYQITKITRVINSISNKIRNDILNNLIFPEIQINSKLNQTIFRQIRQFKTVSIIRISEISIIHKETIKVPTICIPKQLNSIQMNRFIIPIVLKRSKKSDFTII